MDNESLILAKKYANTKIEEAIDEVKDYADTGLAAKASQTDLTTLSGTVSGHASQLTPIVR